MSVHARFQLPSMPRNGEIIFPGGVVGGRGWIVVGFEMGEWLD